MLVIHGLTAILSGLVWLRAFKLRQGDLRDFGDALPTLTQILYDFHLPAVLCVGLVASFTAALVVRGLATIFLSTISVGIAALWLGGIWWALRLPFTSL